MGVVDNMVHTASLKVSSSSNGSHSEERLGRMSLQNGHPAALNGAPKYKRRRVSAVRDFPPGCGQTATKFCVGSVAEAACRGSVENLDDDEKGNNLAGNDSIRPSGNGLDDDDKGNNLKNGSGLDDNNKGNNLNGNNSIQPSGIGAESSAQEVLEGLVQREMVWLQNNMKSSDEKQVFSSVQADGCLTMRPDCDQVDGYEPIKVESVEMPILLPEPEPRATIDRPENAKENVVLELVAAQPLRMILPKDEAVEVFDVSSHSYQSDFAAQKEEATPQSQSESCSPPDVIISVLGKAVTRKYPPRRKVSAVRDFPPFTGRNAPRLSQEQIREVLLAVENKNSRPEKSDKEDISGMPDEKQMKLDIQDGCSEEPREENHVIRQNSAVDGGGNTVMDIVVYTGGRSLGREMLDLSGSTGESEEDSETLESKMVIVQGLAAASYCPWRLGKKPQKGNMADAMRERKVKKQPRALRVNVTDVEASGRICRERNSSPSKKDSQEMQPIVWKKEEDSHEHEVESENPHKAQRPRKLNVSLPPSRPVSSMGTNKDATGMRNKVKESLRLFQAICRKLLQGEEARPQDRPNANKRVDLMAYGILKEKGKFINTGKQILGPVPGVEVGDAFQYRVELNIIGLHRQTQGGIDYVKEGRQILATSIVASGGYDDELDSSDVLIYTGQGGNVMSGGKTPEHQKLERGNLALANSKHRRNPVRVIRGYSKGSDSSEAKGRTYIYDGLYLVEEFWQETGPHGKLVFKFKLCRIPGQPELSWKILKKTKKSKFREGLCKLDISEGKERIPIFAVNSIDDEKPPSFVYTVGVIYPDWCRPLPLKGCNCTSKCSESGDCSCVVKNGGEIPYNHDGAIVEAKPLVYECGPSCKCPLSCYNRVTQRGIKFQFEVFKTDKRGWGVRSLNSIPSGSFICEYAGELLEDKEAERRTGNDEYLFDIGTNYTDNSLWDGLSQLMPDASSSSCQAVEDGSGFTIDAAQYGNVGRFINHSCSPNLYAQNVLYDHEDTRIPHVMFFAMDNIPPLQELTYHYNYMIDQVRDSSGNIKRKDCYCCASECTGRMY